MSTRRERAPRPDEAAARLIERVLSDSAFRAHFRRDPAEAAREAGLDPVEEPTADRALETLELRESKSSLAGALMAAAVEGVALYDVLDQDVSVRHAVTRALSGIGVADAQAAAPAASPDALALVRNENVQLDADGVADLQAGRIDDRIVAVLGEVAKRHEITVSAMKSDHAVQTAGGSVSNHHYGRAVDIAAVDGHPVSPGNDAAREVAAELLQLDPLIRPTELGSPWALSDPSAFTDGDHQDHLHVAFDDPIEPGQAPPAATPDDLGTGDGDDAGGAPDVEADDPDVASDPEAVDDDDSEEDDSEDEVEDDSQDEEEDGSEDEPDEDEPDEVGTDEDDLTDDERQADAETSGEAAVENTEADGDQPDSAEGSGGSEPDLGDIDSAYPGDDATQEQLALWMAAEAQRRGLPPELPVMAALVESGMRNLSGGHADSVGFFQMRAAIWDSGEYAGYGDRPELQLDWFLDHAKAVRQQRVERGLPVTDAAHYGEWIADVERPAEQYRGRYQLRLTEARELLDRGSKHVSAEQVVDEAGAAVPRAGPRARAALAEARRYLGTPYRWGGSTPKAGFDCSGLVQWAYAKAGIRIPRVTHEQILASGTTKVGRNALLPGDLVFFRDSTGYVHHVGMSLGGNRFIHAPHTGDVVKISNLKEPYYAQQFTGARRFDPAAGISGAASLTQNEPKRNQVQVLPAIRADQVTRR